MRRALGEKGGPSWNLEGPACGKRAVQALAEQAGTVLWLGLCGTGRGLERDQPREFAHL